MHTAVYNSEAHEKKMAFKIQKLWAFQWFWGLWEIAGGIASSIKDAAWIRLKPNRVHSTPTQDIVVACQIMEPVLAAEGFAFSRSGLRFTKNVEDVCIEVELQRWKYNQSGRSSSVFPHFVLSSRSFDDWRRQKNSESPLDAAKSCGEFLVIHLGNLSHWPVWNRWDFCSEHKRQRRALSAAGQIRDRAAILSNSIEDKNNLFQKILEYDLVDPTGIIEYIQFKQGDEQAVAVARQYINVGILRKRFFDQRYALFKTNKQQNNGLHYLDGIVRWALRNGFVIR